MNKINSKEDFWKNHKQDIDDQYSICPFPWSKGTYIKDPKGHKELYEELQKHGIEFLVCDDLNEGVLGYVFCRGNHDDEEAWGIARKAFNEVSQTIRHETFTSFKNAINEAIEQDHYIVSCDDARHLLVGYIIVYNSKTVRHEIRLSSLKGTE